MQDMQDLKITIRLGDFKMETDRGYLKRTVRKDMDYAYSTLQKCLKSLYWQEDVVNHFISVSYERKEAKETRINELEPRVEMIKMVEESILLVDKYRKNADKLERENMKRRNNVKP